MAMDDGLLRESLYPVLRRAVNYHRHFLEEGPDGRLHLPRTRSPEYKSGPDCNYDLALLRWGADTLLDITARLGLEDPLTPEWRRIVEKLADFPEGGQGFLIARDVPLDSSHRHYSHLLMIYPLYLVNAEQSDGRMRILRSLDHWHSFPDARCSVIPSRAARRSPPPSATGSGRWTTSTHSSASSNPTRCTAKPDPSSRRRFPPRSRSTTCSFKAGTPPTGR